MTKVKEITPTALYKMLEEGGNIPIMDVRSESEFAEVHTISSINLPLNQLDATTIGKIPWNRNQPIYIICRSGRRSQKACSLLLEAGFSHVYNITGGIIKWQDCGLPITSGHEEAASC